METTETRCSASRRLRGAWVPGAPHFTRRRSGANSPTPAWATGTSPRIFPGGRACVGGEEEIAITVATMESVRDVDPVSELEEAEREARTCLAAWRRRSELEDRLRRAGRRDHEGPQLNQIDREIALAGAEQERIEAARRLGRARERLYNAKAEHANARLPDALAAYADVAKQLRRHREQLDGLTAKLVATGWAYRRAAQDETAATREVLRLANEGVRTPEEREELLQLARGGQLPARLLGEGVVDFIERETRGLYGGGDSPLEPRTWSGIGEAIELGPRRGASRLGRLVRQRVESEWKKLTEKRG